MISTDTFEISILGILSMHSFSGYQLYKEIQDNIGRFSEKEHMPKISKSSIYNVLSNLEKNKYIVAKQKNDKRNTKIFSVTLKGKKYLYELLEKMVYMPVIDPLEYICAFSTSFSMSERRKLIEKRIKIYQSYLNILDFKTKKYKDIFDKDKYSMYIIKRAVHIIKSDIKDIKKLQDD